jgi:hypothetical protein
MAYDPATSQLVLFGGGFGTCADTWTWNGSNWTGQSPLASPSARWLASMAYDPATSQLVLFGGAASNGDEFNDTWTWNGTTWIQLFPSTSPQARQGASMAYDPGTGQLVLFGGDYFADTWTWNGSTWTKLSPSTSPAAREYAPMAFDTVTGQLVLFSGDGSADTWTWNGSDWTEQSPASSPPSLNMEAMSYDPGTGQLVLFGGNDETWTWGYPSSVVTDWTEQTPSTSPPARIDASMSYDPGTGQLVLFGGNNGSGNELSDTWTWDGSNWTEQSPSTSPPARSDASMSYDSGTGQLILFGGNDGSGPLADTWTWNGSNWTEQSPSTSPSARSDASMAYDPGTGQLVLFGGNDGHDVFDGGTWSFSLVKASQSITFVSSAPSSASYSGSNNQTYLVNANASSGLLVTFSIDSSSTSSCAISGSTVSYGSDVGICIIDADETGSGGYLPAEQSQQSFYIGQASQAITLSSSAPSGATVGGTTFTPTASSSSELTVQFSIDGTSSSGACTISAEVVSFTGVGTCVVDANQTGDANYVAAPQVQQSFTIGQGSQAITFVSSAPSSASYSGSNNQTYLANANASSGLPVALSIDPSSTAGCTISGSTVSYGGGVGTCVIDANQLGSDAFLAAPQVQQSFTIAQGWQSITFVSSAPLSASYSGSNNQTYVVNANASSGLPATFSIDSSSTSSCAISGLNVSFGGGVGTCVIDATQAGNASYLTATEVQQRFTISQASQTISFSTTAPSSVTYSESNDQIYLVSASASSDLPVALSIDPSSTSGCTISGLTVSYGGGVGTCVIDANQAGDADSLAAPEVKQSFTIVGPSPPPGYVGVSINSGDYATDSYAVVLDLVWPDGATSALVSNDGGFDAAGGTETIPLSAEVPWGLENTGFNGLPETVYVRFLGAGIDTTTFTDDIILDETVPNVSSATLVGTSGSATSDAVATESLRRATTRLNSYSIKICASEQVTGVSSVALSSVKSGGATFTFTSPKHKGILTFQRMMTVSMATAPRYVRVRSAAGKWSRWLAIATIPRIAIDSNHVVLANSKIPVKLTCESGICSGTVELSGSVTVKVLKGTRTVLKTETVALADATYKLVAETGGTVALALTTTGRKVLAHVATRSLEESLSVTDHGGSTMTRTVMVT